jgi:kumamolisin
VPAQVRWASAAQIAPAGAAGTLPGLLDASADEGPVALSTQLSLILVPRDATAARLAGDLQALYSPGSPSFGHYLTAQEVATRYGPAPSDIAAIRSALRGMGLSMRWTQGDDWMEVAGPASRLEAAFAVQAHWYDSPRGIRFYAAAAAPSLPAALRPYIAEVGQLSSFSDPIQAAVPDTGLSPVNLLSVYDMTPLRQLGLDGTGQTVVFFEGDGFKQAALDDFTSRFNLPPLDPVVKTPEPQSFGGETEMDLEVVHEIAPGAKLVVYNFDPTAKDEQSNANLQTAILDLQSRMIDENPGAVFSESWGICEPLLGKAVADSYENLYDHADALGETVMGITMDNGAYPCLVNYPRGTPPSPEYLGVTLPGDAPGVTAAGGTRLSMSASGGWYDETVWEYPATTAGGGGGVSSFFARPSWQQGPGVQDSQRNPNNMRSVPDVAADADPSSGATICITSPDGTQEDWSTGGGTSQAAPIWAGIAALLDQYLQQQGLPKAGFLNPALYHIAVDQSPYNAFHDITVGSNLYYPALPGYDMATGWGTPDAWNLARDLEAYAKGH